VIDEWRPWYMTIISRWASSQHSTPSIRPLGCQCRTASNFVFSPIYTNIWKLYDWLFEVSSIRSRIRLTTKIYFINFSAKSCKTCFACFNPQSYIWWHTTIRLRTKEVSCSYRYWRPRQLTEVCYCAKRKPPSSESNPGQPIQRRANYPTIWAVRYIICNTCNDSEMCLLIIILLLLLLLFIFIITESTIQVSDAFVLPSNCQTSSHAPRKTIGVLGNCFRIKSRK